MNDSPERKQIEHQRGVLGGLRTATLLMYLSGAQLGGSGGGGGEGAGPAVVPLPRLHCSACC